MNHWRALTSISLTAALAACSSGDITLAPTNVDNSTNDGGGGGGATNPCASYTVGGATRRGAFDGTNCTYDAAFVSDSTPLTVDLTIPFFSGVHIFQSSLVVGQDVSSGVAPRRRHGPDADGASRRARRVHGLRRLPARSTAARASSPTGRRPRRSRSRASRTPCRTPPARTTCSSGAASSSTATGSRTTAPTRNAPTTTATSRPRAARRTTAATTTPTTPASCATSSSSTPVSRSRPATS